MSNLDLAAARQDFPVVESCIYVNHAAVGPIPRSVQQAMLDQTNLHLHDIGSASAIFQNRYQHGRKMAADLVHSSAEQIAYIQSTSHGVSLVANGIDWQTGDNVVVPAQEFPSNYLAWLNLERKGVELRHATAPDGRFTVESVRPLVDRRTKVVALSHVQFYNGYRVDLAPIGELCRQHDALLVVDGTQSIGAMTIDVTAEAVDALIVSAHKWMLGPLGIGFMALSERAFERLRVSNPGWLSVNAPFSFRREIDLLPDARRFEPGTENSAGMFGLAARLEAIRHIGAQNIEARVLALTEQLCQALERRSCAITSPRGRGTASGIVTFIHPHYPSEELIEKLMQANVRASLRNGAIRISPHYYNSEDEIDFIVESLGP